MAFAANASAAGYTAYVVDNSQPGSVIPITTATNTAGIPISFSTAPSALAITPDGKTVYVATRDFYGTNRGTVTPITVATDTPGTPIPVGEAAGIAITPDGKTAYVTNDLYGTVIPITLATGTPGPPIAVGPVPVGIAITPDGKTAYVTLHNATPNGAVVPINLATNTAGAPISVGNAPEGITITPDGKTAYVAVQGDGKVVPITVATSTVGTPIVVGDYPKSIAITSDGATAYVTRNSTNEFSASVIPIAIATNTPGKAISVDAHPAGIAITPDDQTAYVSTNGSPISNENVAVTPITLATNTLGTAIPIGRPGAGAIAITPVPTQGRQSATSVTCSPQSVVAGQATNCTATVSHIDAGAAITPTGTVSFISDSSGSFTGSPCTLSGNGAAASCEVTYTPTAVGPGQHAITANYGGDATHQPSSASTTVKVSTRSTSTSIACSPNPFAPGNATTCTATVSDTDSGTSTTPTGTVDFSSDGAGSFEGSPCTLSESGPGVASCHVSFSLMAPATKTINASYSGDAAHTAGTGSTSVTAALPTSTKRCEIHGAGMIKAADGDHAQFGIAVLTLQHSGQLRGLVSYRDFGPAQQLRLASFNVQALTCHPGSAATGSIFGTGKLNRTTTVFFRIDATAGSESHSARNRASYRIRLSNGYDSGTQTPHPGRVAMVIHRW